MSGLPFLKCETVSSSILWTTFSSRMKSVLNERICSGRRNFFQHRRRKVESIGGQKVCVGGTLKLAGNRQRSLSSPPPPPTHRPTHLYSLRKLLNTAF